MFFPQALISEADDCGRMLAGQWWFGKYRGAKVSFKYYPKRTKVLTHKLKKEVKAMRKLQNKNLAVFWGGSSIFKKYVFLCDLVIIVYRY